MIMYLCIFLGVASIIASQSADTEEKMFEGTDYSIAVFDEDGSEFSKNFVSYLSEGHEVVDVQDDKEVIQDELYNRNISCVVRIPKGFGDSVAQGGELECPEITTIPGTIYGQTFKSLVSNYISLTKSYVAGGYSAEEAMEKAKLTSGEKVTVSMSEKAGGSTHGKIYYYFNYLPYIFISICIVGVGPVLIVFHKKEVRDRNNCSSYSITRTNLQLFAGTVTAGAAISILFALMVMIGTGKDIFSFQGLLYCLNMLCFMVVSLGLVFFLGQVVKQQQVLTMMANVIGLGMSFLCGVFVPLEYMGEGLIRVAHFLPAYWYVISAAFIDKYTEGTPLGELWTGMGIQLLFGVALICVGLAYSRARLGDSRG